MADAAKPTLAERIDQVLRDGMAEVVAEAREEGWRSGYSQGRVEVRREMNDRLRALILEEDGSAIVPATRDAIRVNWTAHIFDQMFGRFDDHDTRAGLVDAAASDRPPTEAGGMTPVKAAEEEAGDITGVATAALSSDAPAPQPNGRPPNTGGEPAAPPEPSHEQDEGPDADPEPGETAAAVPAAAPAGPGAEQALNQAPPPPQTKPEASPTPPAPPAAASHPKPVSPADWRTEERKKVITELYPQGTDMTEIRLTLADMPGPRVPDKNAQLWAWVTALKLRRSSESEAAAPTRSTVTAPARERPTAIHPSIAPPGPRPEGTNPKAAVIPLPAPAENGKVYTSFANIRAWAGVYGIAYDGTNMDRVNKLRIAKSLPLLVLDGT